MDFSVIVFSVRFLDTLSGRIRTISIFRRLYTLHRARCPLADVPVRYGRSEGGWPLFPVNDDIRTLVINKFVAHQIHIFSNRLYSK